MKSMLQYTQKNCATTKSKSARDSFFLSITSSRLRPEDFVHITGNVVSCQAKEVWQHSPNLALSRPHPLPPCSPSFIHILFLLSLLYRFHPLLVSTFSATFWVNVGTLNWLVLCTVGLVTLEITSVNNFESLCVNDDHCVAVVLNFRLPVFSILKHKYITVQNVF